MRIFSFFCAGPDFGTDLRFGRLYSTVSSDRTPRSTIKINGMKLKEINSEWGERSRVIQDVRQNERTHLIFIIFCERKSKTDRKREKQKRAEQKERRNV